MLRGLNWGHRRASGPMNALSAVAREKLGFELVWEQQSLNGFEHGLTAQIANRYDLVIFDHPFCGDIVTDNLLHPLTDWLREVDANCFIGGSLESYRMANELWGLPIDGATQACVYRSDLMSDEKIPVNWDEVLQLGRRLRRKGQWLVLPSLSPHGFLLLLAMCAALGDPWPVEPTIEVPVTTVKNAIQALLEVSELAHPAGIGWNAIDVHDAMTKGNELVYCPAMYVYTTYSEKDHRAPLSFAPFPGPNGTPNGTVLGGTGLGVTRSCESLSEAMRLVTFLASAEVQTNLIMKNHGQPARREAWEGCEADELFSGSHAKLRRTMETTWTRPRFPGYIAWQASCGKLFESLLTGNLSEAAFFSGLIGSWENLENTRRART